jgi:hypothetical protein
VRYAVNYGEHDYWSIMLLGQLACRKSDNPWLPSRPRENQDATLQLLWVRDECSFDIPQHPILEELAALIRLFSLLREALGSSQVLRDQ